MTHQDRDRLVFSVVLALAIHVVIVVMLSVVNWQFREYSEPNPVFVELLDYQSAPPVIEPEPEPVEEDPPEEIADPLPEPVVVDQPVEEVVPEPVDEAVEEQAQVPVETPPAMAADPVVTPAESAETDSAAVPDRSSVDYVAEPAIGLVPESSPDRDSYRRTDEEVFGSSYEEPEADPLAEIFPEGIIPPLSLLPSGDQEDLIQKQEENSRFAALLDAVVQSVNASASADAASRQPPGETETQARVTSLPGDSSLDWVDGGSRGTVGEPALPDIDSKDLGGLVPPRLTYVVVFDVNSDGLVVPGSLILRNSSGYTAADQKVRDALSTWHFEPAPGSQPVTAICTLILERDD